MRLVLLIPVALAGGLATAPAHAAETLRCTGGIASEGDTRISVAYKCGQPLLKDNRCAPVFYSGTLQQVPEPYASTVVPCQPIEDWLYDRGPGNLKAMVRFRSGIVQSIVHTNDPR